LFWIVREWFEVRHSLHLVPDDETVPPLLRFSGAPPTGLVRPAGQRPIDPRALIRKQKAPQAPSSHEKIIRSDSQLHRRRGSGRRASRTAAASRGGDQQHHAADRQPAGRRVCTLSTEHIHDELHARCLVLDDGKTKLALVVCDLLGLHRSVSLEARRLIQEATGIPPENVMISATHTHSAGSALGSSRYVNEQKLDDYQLFLARRISDGVRRALNDRRPAEVAFGSVDVPDHLLNRRWFLRDGKGPVNPFGKVERVWKTGAPGPEFTEPAGPVDPAVSFIALREPGGRPISVYAAYSLHYVGDTGPAHISADYFGMFCEALKRLQSKPEDDPPFVALMANATSGDVGLNQARYNQMNIKKGSYQRSRIVANDLAEKVHGALARVTWKDHAELDVRFREPDIAWRKIEPELLVWAKDVEAKAPRLSGGNLPIGANWATTPDWVTRLSYAGRVQALAKVTEPPRCRCRSCGLATSASAPAPARPTWKSVWSSNSAAPSPSPSWWS
jgi:hypothetical protein